MSAVLTDFDDDFQTATQERSNVLKQIPDGDYEFSVSSASWQPETKAGPIFKLVLELIGGATAGNHCGGTTERAYFLTKDDNGVRVKNPAQVATLRDDLKKLGFDVENWTKENGRPFSLEIGKVPSVIKGVCFKGKKKTNGKYDNLYVNERLATDGKPATFGAAEMMEANKDPFGD